MRLNARNLRRAAVLALNTARGSVRVGDRTFKVNAASLNPVAIEATIQDYEPEMRELFRKELQRRTGVFVDVGANYGQTLLSLLAIDENREYLGIEPQPSCAAGILELIRRNQLRNHQILCCALSETAGLASLSMSKPGDVRASLVAEFRPDDSYSTEMPCLTVPGDELVNQMGWPEVSIIKIDVEGAELEVLRSFRGTLKAFGPTLVFEVLPNRTFESSQLPVAVVSERDRRWAAIARFLDEVAYEAKLLTPLGEDDCAIAPDPEGAVRNYVARPVGH